MNRLMSSGSGRIVAASPAALALTLVLALAAAGCGDSGESTEPAVVVEEKVAVSEVDETEVVAEVESAAVGATAEAAAGEGSLESGGLALEVRDDGTFRLTGADQWGGRIDTAFESLEYLSNAAPVLKRSLTEEQGRALDALIAGAGSGSTSGNTGKSAIN